MSCLILIVDDCNGWLGIEKYGSHPLRTYLPDSDIDITLFFHSLYNQQTASHHILTPEDVYYMFTR
jgi:hypothetical protein